MMMNLRALLLCARLLAGFAVVAIPPMRAQTATAPVLRPVAQADRVLSSPGSLTALAGHLPVWVNRQNLSAAATPDLGETAELTVVLRRADAAEKAFQQQLKDQQTPGSALYHRAVSPDEVGRLYGPTAHDVAAVQAWLEAAGLTVTRISPSRTAMEVRGSLASVEAAFHVHFSMYQTGEGVERGPDAEPMIPTALQSVVAAVAGLTVERAHPEFTGSRGGHYLAPADFATIYNVTPIYSAGNTGAMIGSTRQRVAIVATSDADSNQVQAFLAGIGQTNANSFTQVLATGVSPGYTSSEGEAELDIERVLGTAPGVAVDLVEATSIYTAAYYAVNTLHDPIVNVSFGACEQSMGQANTQRWHDLWATAASNMTSVFVSGGDSGAAACGAHGSQPPATQFLAINGICSSAYNTCVGGTEFNDTANPSQYWSTTNDGTSKQSALGYIPEGVWNEPTSTDANGNVTYRVLAGGGGASVYEPKPTWQTGAGVPADGRRDIPDISFTAAGHDAYFACATGHCDPTLEANPQTFVAYGYYGTSASSPSMAGIAALLNTSAGAPQGLLNPAIYRLAGSAVAGQIFHDVTLASAGVTNCDVTVPSLCNNSTAGPNSLMGGQAGFAVTDGYDLATGWGSLNVANFIRAAVPVSTTLSLAVSGSAIGVGQSVTTKATLTANGTSLAGPTGTVQFLVNGVASGGAVALAGGTATSPALTFPAVGNYVVTAVYSGDALYAGSTAGAVTVAVAAQPPSLGLAVAAPSLAFSSGATNGNSVALTVTGMNNYAGTVALTCGITSSSAAFQPACTVMPATVTLAANGTATATVAVSSTSPRAVTGRPLAYLPGAKLPMLLSGLLGMWMLRRRRVASVLLLVLAAASLQMLAGCGKSSSGAEPPQSSAGSYTVTVMANGTGTGAVAQSTASAQISVTIQ